MQINVTKQDISEGRQNDCERCPIALAVQRQTNKYCSIGNYILLGDGGSIILPPEVIRFIKDFDNGRTVKPFSFEI